VLDGDFYHFDLVGATAILAAAKLALGHGLIVRLMTSTG
jgi:hypothetical protein